MTIRVDLALLSEVELAEHKRLGKLEGIGGIVGRVVGFGLALSVGIALLVAIVIYTRESGFAAFANMIMTPAGVIALGYCVILAIGSILTVEAQIKKAAEIRQLRYRSWIDYDQRERAAKHKLLTASSDDNGDHKHTLLTGSSIQRGTTRIQRLNVII